MFFFLAFGLAEVLPKCVYYFFIEKRAKKKTFKDVGGFRLPNSGNSQIDLQF